jgi:magnesium chelatase family protein
MLVAAANPCPCGYLGDTKRECKCSPRMVMKYNSKLSGPLMDRIDLHISVPVLPPDKLAKFEQKSESSASILKRVIKARTLQAKRFKGTKVVTNADMKNKLIKEFCNVEKDAFLLLKQAVNNYGLSARTYFRLIKVSQTISDLSGDTKVMQNHVAEALQYRIREQE